MEKEILYMLGVVAVGFTVNYSLRALPFLLFAGRDRALPPWVTRFGNLISPIIIGALIVYSYSGLEWRTAWPYLAGALTVSLQLWKRNPLVSIVAGTVLYMSLVSGCKTAESEFEYGASHPCIAITSAGCVEFAGKPTSPAEVPRLLEKHQVPHDATIHILVDDSYDNRRLLWVFQHNVLAKAGYGRSITISKRKAESEKRLRGKRTEPEKRKIRYKGANE